MTDKKKLYEVIQKMIISTPQKIGLIALSDVLNIGVYVLKKSLPEIIKELELLLNKTSLPASLKQDILTFINNKK